MLFGKWKGLVAAMVPQFQKLQPSISAQWKEELVLRLTHRKTALGKSLLLISAANCFRPRIAINFGV
jgi:hypothetical protein